MREVCRITHEHGGQVYLDGANLNAMVGVSRPGDLGAVCKPPEPAQDLLHSPWRGRAGHGAHRGVKAHLASHLPGHPEMGGRNGPVSGRARSAPLRSLPISYAYISGLMGGGGPDCRRPRSRSWNAKLPRRASGRGVRWCCSPDRRGRVAHECIIDTRPFAEAGVTVDDIAKRLMDHGFHAPTMSWPVAGTLMIEPTESEPKAELDPFRDRDAGHPGRDCRGRGGTDRRGGQPVAPCAAHYGGSRARLGPQLQPRTGMLPAGGAFRVDKYWPPVNRVDNAYGDRNLVCTCPPLDSYLDAAE